MSASTVWRLVGSRLGMAVSEGQGQVAELLLAVVLCFVCVLMFLRAR
jgi:hypothetical protein